MQHSSGAMLFCAMYPAVARGALGYIVRPPLVRSHNVGGGVTLLYHFEGRQRHLHAQTGTTWFKRKAGKNTNLLKILPSEEEFSSWGNLIKEQGKTRKEPFDHSH